MLAVELSPRTWGEIKFQDHVTKTLSNSLIKGEAPNVLLLTGNSGIGKTSTANVYMASVLCENRAQGSPDPCGHCVNCVDIFEDICARNFQKINGKVQNTKSHFRDVLDNISKGGTIFGKKRGFLIEEAHGLTDDAMESLLVPTESKRLTDVYFILTTTEKIQIKNTLKSRSMSFSLIDPTYMEVAKYLNETIVRLNWDVPQDFRTNMLFDVIESVGPNIRGCINTIKTIYLSGDYSEENVSRLLTSVSSRSVYSILKDFMDGEIKPVLTSIEKSQETSSSEEIFNNFFFAALNLHKYVSLGLLPSARYSANLVKSSINKPVKEANNRLAILLKSLYNMRANGNVYDKTSLSYVVIDSFLQGN